MTRSASSRLPLSGSEPVFTIAPFGTPKGIRSNNCTAYSYQVYSNRDGYKLQPGELAGLTDDFPLSTCGPLKKRIVADLKAQDMGYGVPSHKTPCAKGYAKIMVFLDPDTDYHFVRQNGDVVYTVKPGDTKTTIARKFKVPLKKVVMSKGNSTARIVGANVWSHKRGTAFGPDLTNARGDLIFNPLKSSLNYGDYDYDKHCGTFCIKQKPCPNRKNATNKNNSTNKTKPNNGNNPNKKNIGRT